MHLYLYIFLFALGVLFFFLSSRTNQVDLSNTYQVMFSLLSLLTWIGLLLNSFNIELYSDTLTSKPIYDYTFIAISLLFSFMSLINTIVLLLYGSFNQLFKVK